MTPRSKERENSHSVKSGNSVVVTALERGQVSAAPLGISCVLGEDVKFRYGRLQNYYWSKLSPVDVDLLALAGLVVLADRSVRRSSSHWARKLVLIGQISGKTIS